MIYTNKTENKLTLEIKTGVFLNFSLLKQWNYLQAFKQRKKEENGENVPYVEIT